MSKPFRSDKRKKELQRLKKQEEKRQRRFGLKHEKDETSSVESMEDENKVTEPEENEPENNQISHEVKENGQ